MNQYPTPLSFQPNHVPPPLVPLPSSSSLLTLIKNEIPPSTEQHTAVAILRKIPNSTIIAWLEGFRSLLRGEQWFHPHHLSHQQRQAVSALKDCSDDLVLTWLTFARSPSALNASQSLHGNGNLNNDRVTANALGQSPSPFSDPFIRTTPKSPWDQESYNLSRGASVGEQSSPATTSNHHDHWCFVCEDPKPITTCDGFKRHIREHEKRYYCITRESVVDTADGPRCAFCDDVPNPDLRHRNTHSVPECVGRNYTRKKALIQHLEKNHDVDDGSVLAEESIYTVYKKYFACGFCVAWFSSLKEQVNHIDAHYRSSKHIHDWDSDKVIRGLLSQPTVNEHWRNALAANPHLQESWFRWDPTVVKQLQYRLERSREPADVLFAAAFDQSNYGRSDAGFAGLKTHTSQSMQVFQHQHGWSPLPSSSNQDSTASAHDLPMKTPILQTQQLACNGIGPDTPRWNGISGSRSVPQVTSETYGSSTSMAHHHSSHLGQPRFSPNSGQSFMQHQHPALVSSIASAIDIAQAWEAQADTTYSSGLGGHSQDALANVATSPRSRQAANAHEYSAQGRTGRFHSTLTTRSASLSLSPNRPTSQSGQSTSPFGPTNHETLVARSQGTELMDYYGIDVEVGINNMQHIMNDQDHNRRQE